MGIETLKPNQEVDSIEAEVNAVEELRNRIEEKAKNAPEETKLQMLKAGVKKWGGRLLLALGIGGVVAGAADSMSGVGQPNSNPNKLREFPDILKTDAQLDSINAERDKQKANLEKQVEEKGKDQGFYESGQ